MNDGNKREKPLWAQLRDTHGRDLPSSVPLSTLLAAHPILRSMSAPELAEAIQVPVAKAEAAIDGYVRDAIPRELVADMRGASVDERIAQAGRPRPPGWLVREGGRLHVKDGAPAEAGAFNYAPNGTDPLPLGFFYRMPNRMVYEPSQWAKYASVVNEPLPTPIRVDAPTDFDALVCTVLRGEIEADPQDPSLPHPMKLRAFCVAMGGPLLAPVGDGLPFHPGGVYQDGTAQKGVAAAAAGVSEFAPTWPAPQPGEVFPLDAARKAFAAFQWYGPLPGDLETPEGVQYFDGWAGGVTRERYVYWYQIDDDGNWNRCMQVQGYVAADKKWVLPKKWGEALRAWEWRPSSDSDPHNVGEWKTFFSFDNFLRENQSTIVQAAFWVASIAVTVATLGAGAATLAAAATIGAILAAATKLYSALYADDPAKAVGAVLELGRAMNTATGGDFAAAVEKNNPGLATFAKTVAAPFQKIYEAAGGALGTIGTLWQQAQAMKNGLPIMGQVAWSAAVSAFGNGTSGPSAWLQMARLPTSSEIAQRLYDNAPPWVKDVVALGLAINATEQAQSSNLSGSYGFTLAPVVAKSKGVMKLTKAGQEGMKALWQPPPPPLVPPVPKFVPKQGSGPKAAAGGAAAVAVVGAGIAYLLFFL